MTKSLIITGGSRGIGLATAELFQGHGYRVINLSRSPTPLENVLNLAVDLGKPDWDRAGAAELHALIRDRQHIVLVHNAGLLRSDSALDLDGEALREVLQVNLVAPVQLNRLVLPLMEPGSAILYVGSTLSVKARGENLLLQHLETRAGGPDARHLPGPGRQRYSYGLCVSGFYRNGHAARARRP